MTMTERIKVAHDKKCDTPWERWTTRERDTEGRMGTCHWYGCKTCDARVLEGMD